MWALRLIGSHDVALSAPMMLSRFFWFSYHFKFRQHFIIAHQLLWNWSLCRILFFAFGRSNAEHASIIFGMIVKKSTFGRQSLPSYQLWRNNNFIFMARCLRCCSLCIIVAVVVEESHRFGAVLFTSSLIIVFYLTQRKCLAARRLVAQPQPRVLNIYFMLIKFHLLG